MATGLQQSPVSDTPASVLFACTLNSVRSPMAAAITKHLLGRRVYVDSAGVDPQPLDPMAAEVLAEVGIEIGPHQCRAFDPLMDTSFDLVISFSKEADAEAQRINRTSAAQTEYWPTDNPGLAEGSRETRLCMLRHIRDDLLIRIRRRFEGALETAG